MGAKRAFGRLREAVPVRAGMRHLRSGRQSSSTSDCIVANMPLRTGLWGRIRSHGLVSSIVRPGEALKHWLTILDLHEAGRTRRLGRPVQRRLLVLNIISVIGH